MFIYLLFLKSEKNTEIFRRKSKKNNAKYLRLRARKWHAYTCSKDMLSLNTGTK